MKELTMTELTALCKTRGFIFAGSEIYGGLANTWDSGPLGAELKQNIKKLWWNKFVQQSPYSTGVDCAILMNPKVWEASGHISNFGDPLMDCKACKTRHRADKLVEEWLRVQEEKGVKINAPIVEALSDEELYNYIMENKIVCPHCGKLDYTKIRQFNLMFKTFMGVTEDSASQLYLRPETAGGIFVNFKNVMRATRAKLPLGIGQIGKAFRNEITPGNFIFRMREFEQMEYEFFCSPNSADEWFKKWCDTCWEFCLEIGLDKEKMRRREHEKEELCHYSNGTTDIEFKYPFGWGELWGIANRTNYDLTQHSQVSGEDLSYTDPFTNETYIPYVIEPSVGVDRLSLAILCSAYDVEQLDNNDERVVLRFNKHIAPIKIAILPLSKKLEEKSLELYKKLAKHYRCEYDVTGSIGKRYRRQDEIGTPFCLTVDFDTLEDNCVTIRDRDTMKQVRININDLDMYFYKQFND